MSDGAIKLPNAKVVASLARTDQELKTKVGKLTGTFAETLQSHAENGNLHLGAAKFVFGLNRKEEIARKTFWEHALAYYDMLDKEIWSKQEHTGSLLDKTETDADADEEVQRQAAEKKQAAANGAAVGGGIKKLDTEGGANGSGGGDGKVTPLKVGGGKPRTTRGMPSSTVN